MIRDAQLFSIMIFFSFPMKLYEAMSLSASLSVFFNVLYTAFKLSTNESTAFAFAMSTALGVRTIASTF